MSSNILKDPSIAIQKAASRVRGDRFHDLLSICEQQKTIRVDRLRFFLSVLLESDRLDGIHFKALADEIRDLRSALKVYVKDDSTSRLPASIS